MSRTFRAVLPVLFAYMAMPFMIHGAEPGAGKSTPTPPGVTDNGNADVTVIDKGYTYGYERETPTIIPGPQYPTPGEKAVHPFGDDKEILKDFEAIFQKPLPDFPIMLFNAPADCGCTCDCPCDCTCSCHDDPCPDCGNDPCTCPKCSNCGAKPPCEAKDCGHLPCLDPPCGCVQCGACDAWGQPDDKGNFHSMAACGKHRTCEDHDCVQCPVDDCGEWGTPDDDGNFHSLQDCEEHRTCEECDCPELVKVTSDAPETDTYLDGTHSVEVTVTLDPEDGKVPSLRYDLRDVENDTVVMTHTASSTNHTFSISLPARYTIEVTIVKKSGEDGDSVELESPFVLFDISVNKSGITVQWDDAPIEDQFDAMSSINETIATQVADIAETASDIKTCMDGITEDIQLTVNQMTGQISSQANKISALETALSGFQEQLDIATAAKNTHQTRVNNLTNRIAQLTDRLNNGDLSVVNELARCEVNLAETKPLLEGAIKNFDTYTSLTTSYTSVISTQKTILGKLEENSRAFIAAAANSAVGVMPGGNNLQRIANDFMEWANKAPPSLKLIGETIPVVFDAVFFVNTLNQWLNFEADFEAKVNQYEAMTQSFEAATEATEITRKVAPLADTVTLTTTPGGVTFRLSEEDIEWVTEDDELKPKTEDDMSDFDVFAYPGNTPDYDRTWTTSGGGQGTSLIVFWFWGNLGSSTVHVGEEDEDGKTDIIEITMRSAGTTEEDAIGITTVLYQEQVRKFEEAKLTVDLILDGLAVAASAVGLIAAFVGAALLIKVTIVAGIVLAVASILTWLFAPDPPPIATVIENFPTISRNWI